MHRCTSRNAADMTVLDVAAIPIAVAVLEYYGVGGQATA
jgi:hypothetical protein